MIATGLDVPWVGGVEGFRQAFDPKGNLNGKDQELVSSLLEKRKNPVSTTLIRGLGERVLCAYKRPTSEASLEPEKFSGIELLAREAVHLGLTKEVDELREIAALLGMSEVEMRAIHDNTIAQIDAEVDQAVRFFDAVQSSPDLLNESSRIVGVNLTHASRLVIAGALLPVALHAGIRRQNKEKNPYFTHPVGTGALYNIAAKRVLGRLKGNLGTVELPDANDLYTQEFRNYVHDSIEEIIRNGDTPLFHGNRTQLTPLAQERLLLRLGVSDGKASEIVRDSVLVTKTRDVQGDSFPKEVYMGRSIATIGAELTKLSDIMYNWVIDPKDVKDAETEDRARRKDALYEKMASQIMEDIKSNKKDEFGYLVACEILQTANEFRGNVQGFAKYMQGVELGYYPELQAA